MGTIVKAADQLGYTPSAVSQQLSTLDPFEMVRRGDLDVAFAVEREPDPQRNVGLERMLVARDWIRLVVRAGTLESTSPVALDVVADRPFIVPPPGDAYCFVVNKALATMSSPPIVAHHIADLPTILRLVRAASMARIDVVRGNVGPQTLRQIREELAVLLDL